MAKVQLNLKYSFDCDPRDLFLALTKASYLQNWIAEKVDFNPRSEVYTFHWSDFSESARISESRQNEFLKWEWIGEDRESQEYVSFRIEDDPEDKYLDLYIEDFCDDGDQENYKDGWNRQMGRLERLVN